MSGALLLDGKVAVITGASGGLGVALLHAFLQEGARVVAVSRSKERLENARLAVAGLQKTLTDKAFYGVCQDLVAPDGPERIIEGALRAYGRIDVLVNNAAVFVWKPLLELALDDWQQSIDTNLTAPFQLLQLAAKQMVKQGTAGSIINMGSIHSRVPDGYLVPQCASKFGIIGLTQAAAEALRESGIRVNAVCPGEIEPDSAHKQSASPNQRVTQGDVAQIAVYLASDRSRPVTGTSIDAFGASRPMIHPVHEG